MNQAITRMDHATQQNAALVEEAAAAAESMEQHAQTLARSVAVFQLANGGSAQEPAAAMAEWDGASDRPGRNHAKNGGLLYNRRTTKLKAGKSASGARTGKP